MKQLMLIFTFLFSLTLLAQKPVSIQVNGGFINPVNAKKGLTGSLQLNYSFNSKYELYFYSGYSNWNKNKIIFQEDINEIQKQQNISSYSKDNHKLIPVYIGGKVNLHTNKLFTSFVNVEFGYSYLSYTEYFAWDKVVTESGEIIDYNVNTSASMDVNESLFGIGLGGGIFRNIGSNISLVLSFKLNSFVNSKYHGLFTGKGTYSMFLAGFNFAV